jgi:hypothetical protein
LQNLQLRLQDSANITDKPVFVIINENTRRAQDSFDHLRSLAGQKIITFQGNVENKIQIF